MTDERIAEVDLLRGVERLPTGAAVVVRHYGLGKAERRRLFDRIVQIARRRRLLVLLAGDPALARRWGAHGHHGPDPSPRGAGPAGRSWLHSAPVHDRRQLRQAIRAGAGALLVSPLFATRSHPGARPLGPARFAALARRSSLPVIALGGVAPRHERLVRRLGAAGFAAVDGLTPKRRV